MLISKKIIFLLFTLLYNICIKAIPISASLSAPSTLSSDTLITAHFSEEQKAKLIDNLTSSVAYHITFDHIDRIIYQLSQHTANILQSSMKIEWDESKNDSFIPIDMTILIDQLQGAVVSFIEDKLPTIWNKYLKLDLNTYIRQQLIECSQSSYTLCLDQYIINQYLHQQFNITWEQIFNQELPFLLEAVHKQVNGILLQLLNNENHNHQQQYFKLTWQLNQDQLKLFKYRQYYNDELHHHPSLYKSMLQTILSSST
ncbi:hypothetical protein BJ944DRAFT_244129 [Cunninghamella echinulata]|nr:hypothetical protein BJ944DRAFT_244129 [Cunninghamella echinulata]